VHRYTVFGVRKAFANSMPLWDLETTETKTGKNSPRHSPQLPFRFVSPLTPAIIG
jgi:hypothetical protein